MTAPQLCVAMAALAAAGALLELLGAVQRQPRRPRSRPIPRRAGRRRWSGQSVGEGAHAGLVLAAGARGPGSSAALMRRCQSAAAVAGCWGAALGWLAGGWLGALITGILGAAAGGRVPIAAAQLVARRRALELRAEAPEVLALLATASSCGLSPAGALEACGRWLESELAAGCRMAARDLGRGAALEPVLRRLAQEHPIDEIDALVAVMLRSRTHGAALAPTLRVAADAARDARARASAEAAARAAPRIQLVAALLLVPAALCLLAGAMVAGGLGG